MENRRFALYAWGNLAYSIGVVLWGAYVRATGSGAGCGSHWPLCDGLVVPRPERVETVIEFTHRLSSGLALVLVIGLMSWALRSYPKGHRVRLGASLALFFMVTEALVGAGLVLFELVAQNQSVARAIAISIHLVNTFLLLAALTITAWWASGGQAIKPNRRSLRTWAFALGVLGMLVLGVSGALTALGDTLFPSASLVQGLQQDLSPTAHFLIRLRLMHPFIAVGVGVYLIVLVRWGPPDGRSPSLRFLARLLSSLVFIQLMVGAVNVILLAPIWLQLVHLFLADLTWIALVLSAVVQLSEPAPAGQTSSEKSHLLEVVEWS